MLLHTIPDSEIPVRSLSGFSRLSSITGPSLLHKRNRSKGPSLHRHYPASSVPLTLSDTQMIRHPDDGVCGTRPHDHPGPPLPTLDYLSGVLYPLPRWIGSVHDGYRVGAFPCRVLPNPLRLPRFRDGSASTLQLSGPARISHALRPARLLAHH
jgi:hypothetical protein